MSTSPVHLTVKPPISPDKCHSLHPSTLHTVRNVNGADHDLGLRCRLWPISAETAPHFPVLPKTFVLCASPHRRSENTQWPHQASLAKPRNSSSRRGAGVGDADRARVPPGQGTAKEEGSAEFRNTQLAMRWAMTEWRSLCQRPSCTARAALAAILSRPDRLGFLTALREVASADLRFR